MTSEQDALIAQFKAANAEASSLEGCDPGNDAQLQTLGHQMRDLALKLQASGLQMDMFGEWTTPTDRTFDYAASGSSRDVAQ